MTAEALTITEITGSRRSVELRDRALPYRPVAWGGTTKHQKKVYAGNPVATIQVLGPDERDTKMNGKWKTRYIGEMVTLSGFDDAASPFDLVTTGVTAEDVERAFEQLRLGGNLLEVRWGPKVRRGILAEFDADFDRVEDIAWTCNFVWSQIGEATAPTVPDEVAAPENALNDALSSLEDVMSQLPPIILPNVTGPLIFAEQAMRGGVLSMTANIGLITGIPDVSLAQFQGLASLGETVGAASLTMVQYSMDQSIEEWIASNTVGNVLEVETFRRDLGAAATAVWAAALAAVASVRARVVDDYLAIMQIRMGQTLRTLARDYYGSGDAWVTIADANGLTSSIVAPGTTVRIPRRSRSGVGATA